MNYIIILILGILILGPILFGYYLDYKSDPKEFKFSLKRLKSLLIILIIYFVVNETSELIFPLNNNHGIEFNSEREKYGIPVIGDDWKIDEYNSKQFRIEWWKPEPRNGHFKKIIEYGYLNIKKEIDYYHNPKDKLSYGWTVYNYDTNKIEYYLELTNYNRYTTSKKGIMKLEKPTKIRNVSKSEFENYIVE
jgi:hypothetical protein